MAVLRSLVTTLGLNSSQYRSELKRSDQSTKQWSDNTRKYSRRAKDSLGEVGSASAMLKTQLTKLAGPIAGAFAVGSITAYVSASMDALDQTQKFADRINITTDALQSLRYAAGQSGVEMRQLDTSLQRMTRRVSEAAAGTGAAKDALDELGLSAVELNQLSPDQQLKLIADAMSGITNEQDRLRLAVKIFDQEGAGMVNLLREGSDGITEMQTRAHSLGRVISRDMIDNVADANDRLDDLGSAAWSTGYIFAARLAPSISSVAKALTDLLTGETFSNKTLFEKELDVANKTIDSLEARIEGLRNKKPLQFAIESSSSGYGDEPVYAAYAEAQHKSALVVLEKELEAALKKREDVQARLNQLAEKEKQDTYEMASIPAKPQLEQEPPGGLTEAQLQRQADRNAAWILQLQQRLMTEEELIQSRYEQEQLRAQQEIEDAQMQAEALKLIEENKQNEITELKRKAADEQLRYQQAAAGAVATFTAQSLSITTNMLHSAGKEQSGLYKVLFAAQKAAAIPGMIIATEEAAVKALAAVPPPYNVALSGAVRAMGYAGVGIVGGQALGGMAHDGIDNIPREGTWLLDKGERVVDSRTNQDLKNYLNQNNNTEPQASEPNWQIIINEAPEGTTADVDSANQIVTIAVAQAEKNTINQIRRGGPITEAGQRHLGWQRSPSR